MLAMEALKSGFLVWHPALPSARNYRRHAAFCSASTNVAPGKRGFSLPDCLLHLSVSTILNRRRLSAIRNPRFRIFRAASTNGYIDGEFRGINDEFSDIKLDAGNGAVTKDFNKECFRRGIEILGTVLSFLPGGSWWKVGGAVQNGSQIKGPSVICTLRRIWALIAPDKLIIFGAFSALIIAAISEISIPHFVAATIFSAQSGSKVNFYRNAQLLALMSCTFGLFSGIRGACFGIANQFLVQRMREKLFLVLLCQDIAFFDTEAVGALTSRLGTDCEQVSHIIGTNFNIMFRNGLQGIGALIYLVILSWQLALSTVLLCCLMSTILFLYGRFQKNMAKFAQEVVASANEVAQETLSLARIVRTFGTEKQECERYSKWLKKLVDINLRQSFAYGLCTWSSNTFYNATQVAETRFGSHTIVLRRLVKVKEALKHMVISAQWGIWKNSNRARAINVRRMILDEDWWGLVNYVLEIIDPIMAMLRFANSDQPCLGDIYDSMDSMLEKIKMAIQRRENDPEDTLYKKVEKIVHHRCNKMTTPLHLLAYALSPRYYSAEVLDLPGRVPPFRDAEVVDGYKKTLAKIFQDPEIGTIVRSEFAAFNSGEDFLPIAIADRSRMSAIKWWYLHGQACMYLQPLAIKVLSQVVALLMGGGFVMNGHITAEQLTKFILYSEWVIHSIWWVGDHWASLMQSIGASEKVFELLELPPSKQLTSQGLRLPELEGHIKFLDVSFNYPARPVVPVLQNVNLSIASGELVALVGLSGSGKSTLVNLLLRLYEPASGQILVDRIPLNELDVMWLRSKIGVVSQEPRLFSMDIASNISYGCTRKVRHSEIEWAAKQAHAHEFIISLPEGYKTLINNARLSGGQKQRISIARAILRKPAVLVLDEATSALDAESENYIKKAIERIMHKDGKRKRTVLVIAHRLSTIRAADRIVVMENGRIVEMGSHDELLKKKGKYAKLTSRQISSIT